MAEGRRQLRVCSFESRRAAEMAALLERSGAVATVAPSMRELPLDDEHDAFGFLAKLLAGEVDVVVFLTGVGAERLREASETRHDWNDVLAALRKSTIVVRGPKPTAVLHRWDVPIHVRAPEPNTWRELLEAIDANLDVAGRVVAVQEYGEPNGELYHELERRGADVLPVPIYRWGLPDDVGPLEDAVRKTISGDLDVLMVTSAQQIRHVVRVAEQLGLHDDWRRAARKCVIASIGPTASEAIADCGLPVDVEASPPKMGVLVRDVVERGPELLSAARNR